jgi:Uma2 family endonuclease
LKGSPCRVVGLDQRVKAESSSFYTYPDLVIFCGPGQYQPDKTATLLNPTAIFEVLSESTEKCDRSSKFRLYQQIPSLKEYILVSQEEPLCDRFTRLADGTWSHHTSFVGLDESLQVACV